MPGLNRERSVSAGTRWPTSLWLLLLAACALRTTLALQTGIIGTDGESYIWMAEDFRSAAYSEALFNPLGYHPLYSIAIAVVWPVLGDPVAAAFVISVVLSSLVVVPFFALVREIWGRVVALLTVFLYAVHPDLLATGGDTMTEGTYLFFFFSSLALFWAATRRGLAWLALAAGLCGGLAFLTRVEGIYLPSYLGLGVVVLIAGDLMRRRWSAAGRRGLVFVAFVVGFGVAAAPYVGAIHHFTGGWHFTTKASVPFSVAREAAAARYARAPGDGSGVDVEPRAATSERVSEIERWRRKYGRIPGAALGFLKDFYRAGEFVHLPLVLIGIVMAMRHRRASRVGGGDGRLGVLFDIAAPASRRGVAFLNLWALGCLLPIFLSFCSFRSDSDTRYYLAGHMFLFPWGAVALAGMWGWGDRVGPPRAGGWRFVAVVAAVAMVVIAGVKVARNRRYDQSLVVEAGRVIRDVFPADTRPRVLATRQKFAYYAGSRRSPPMDGRYESVLETARRLGLPIVVGFRKDLIAADPRWDGGWSEDDLERLPVPNPDREGMRSVDVFRVKGVPVASRRD